MSKALKCDICKKYFDYNKKYTGIMIRRYEAERGEEPILSPSDICPDCYNAIMGVIDSRSKTVNSCEDD